MLCFILIYICQAYAVFFGFVDLLSILHLPRIIELHMFNESFVFSSFQHQHYITRSQYICQQWNVAPQVISLWLTAILSMFIFSNALYKLLQFHYRVSEWSVCLCVRVFIVICVFLFLYSTRCNYYTSTSTPLCSGRKSQGSCSAQP